MDTKLNISFYINELLELIALADNDEFRQYLINKLKALESISLSGSTK